MKNGLLEKALNKIVEDVNATDKEIANGGPNVKHLNYNVWLELRFLISLVKRPKTE